MQIKHLMQRFIYRIEPKPEGGFIARPADPSAPTLEASTREELQQKIQANLVAAMSEAFPGLKLPLENGRVNFEVHVGRKPGGGFTVHSERVGKPVMGTGTHEKVDHFAEELLGFVEKHFPEFSQAMAASAVNGDGKIFASQKAAVPLQTGTRLSGPQESSPSEEIPTPHIDIEGQSLGARTGSSDSSLRDVIANTPITPQTSGSWTILRFILTLLFIAAVMYFYLHRH
jgi:hypothetical protein